jgi:hypothetical protein
MDRWQMKSNSLEDTNPAVAVAGNGASIAVAKTNNAMEVKEDRAIETSSKDVDCDSKKTRDEKIEATANGTDSGAAVENSESTTVKTRRSSTRRRTSMRKSTRGGSSSSSTNEQHVRISY